MRIGLLAADFWPNVGGVAAHVVELGRALVDRGHQVHVLSRPLGDAKAPYSTLHGMHVHRPPLVQLRPFSHWALHRWLKHFLQKHPLDVLHVHGMRPLPATVGLEIPVIFTNHTSGFLKRMQQGPAAKRRVLKWMKHLQAILAPSEELVEASRSVGVSCPVDFLSNGVDPQRFSPGPSRIREQLGITQEETVVLLARRLVKKNGVVVFAEAASEFMRAGVRLLFAGDGPERNKVESILKSTGCLDAAIFLGNVPNPRMPEIYRAADISVLPSFMEATSITGLESMATGLPLVGTRVGGIPFLIDNGQTGRLVEPGTPRALAAAIRTLIDAPELRKQFGQAARDKVERTFSWNAIAEQTVLHYQRCRRRNAA